MVEQHPQTPAPPPPAPKQKVKLKHGGARGQRFVFDATGTQHLIGPGQEIEVEMTEVEVKRLKEAAEKGHGDLTVDGADPVAVQEEANKVEGDPEIPEEHHDRHALAEKELELMQAGQEAGKEAREKLANMDRQVLAARTGIGIIGRGGIDALATVASPPDAPIKRVKREGKK